MKKIVPVLAISSVMMIMAGCSSSGRYSMQETASDSDEYVYVIDRDKINQVEYAIQNSSSNLRTVWVNPPIKRIKKSELEDYKSSH